MPLLFNLPGSASNNRMFSGYKVGTTKDGTAGKSVLWTLYLEKKWRITRGKEKFFDGYKTTIAPPTEQRGQTVAAQRNYGGNS